MGKKLVTLIICFVIMGTYVAGAQVWSVDDTSDNSLTVLISAYGDSKGFYYDNENVYNGMNLYQKTITAYEIKAIMEFQVLVSSWMEVSSVEFYSTEENVADISVRLNEKDESHIFTLWATGYGTSTIYMSINESDPIVAFRVIVGEEKKEPDKPVKEIDYESILMEAKRNIPSVYIVNNQETITTSDSFNVGDSRTYHMAVRAQTWTQDFLEYCFYQSGGYYFFLDTERIAWSVPQKIVSYFNDGPGVTVTGITAGTDTIKVEVPVCAMYFPIQYNDKDGMYLNGQFASQIEVWDIGSLTAEAKLQVIEKKQEERKAPYNPFKGIDVKKVENPFTDISPNDWYYEPIMYLYAAGILNGVDFNGNYVYYAGGKGLYNTNDNNPSYLLNAQNIDGTHNLMATEITRYLKGNSITMPSSSGGPAYQPNSASNRQNAVHELYNQYKAIGYFIGSYTNNPFVDVNSYSKAYQPILWASANKVVNGYGNGRFGPLDHITREQFCAIILRHADLAGIKLPKKVSPLTFTDNSSISSWAANAVSACQQAGIIKGYPEAGGKYSFKPKGDITNAEIAQMIYNYTMILP